MVPPLNPIEPCAVNHDDADKQGASESKDFKRRYWEQNHAREEGRWCHNHLSPSEQLEDRLCCSTAVLDDP
jgi:hypothetical protein